MSKTLQIALVSVLGIVTVVVGRKTFQKYNNVEPIVQAPAMEISEEHCRMMPTMTGCKVYDFSGEVMSGEMDHSTMDHVAMVTDINSYLREMVLHHQEAVDSSQVLIDKTLFLGDKSDDIQVVAQNIISGQSLEINQLNSRIVTYFNNQPYETHYMNMMRDVSSLSDIPTIKKMYAEDMILHHQGAIDMSQKLLSLMTEEDKVIKVNEETMKLRKDIKSFAQNVINDQTKEIAELQDILTSYTTVSIN